MRETLLKKRYGIPTALLLILLLSGTAIAWYCFATISSETEVKEPLSATETKEFATEMYPGETNIWTFNIVNSNDKWYYSVKADLTFNAPSGVSIILFTVGIADKTDDLLDGNSAEFSILADQTLTCSMTIRAAKDAAPGDVTVSLCLSRE